MFCAKLWQKAEGAPFLRSRTSHKEWGRQFALLCSDARRGEHGVLWGWDGAAAGVGGVGSRLFWEAGTSVDKVQLVVSDWIFED